MKKTNILSFILRAKNRFKIMKELEEDKKIPLQIKNQTGMYKSHISRTLKELIRENLVECINPKDRAFKFYRLTLKGKRSLSQAKKLLKEIRKK